MANSVTCTLLCALNKSEFLQGNSSSAHNTYVILNTW